ncbi:uracil-DNA glycosylase [Zeaxanthinibacter sp. PT1]|uniref:uracil-DNA glycosylase n=1 Tax=Zeaxanthinibacter TaxID=561554 RepID=UPI00234B750D|nr:uracil-DNA glycosylase [Zeaxanthinibacter sp. PT1]MDC6351455.1 uracil-DNA glycosylase [Zeaxanthinibacter sp. PT1]
MKLHLPGRWSDALSEECKKPYFESLMRFVQGEYRDNTCFPPGEQIFRAFDQLPYEEVKVVILGQDPYHGYGQADGLCFSVGAKDSLPPSLVNIYKELAQDLGREVPANGDLSHWARQGVLLLNATLTVREKQAGSHQGKGWEKFTDAIIRVLNEDKTGLIFLLWGGYARKKVKLIDSEKHYILTSGHPSPLSANRGYWFGNKHFSKTNQLLLKQGKPAIEW